MSSNRAATPSLSIVEDMDWWALKYTVVRLALEFDLFTAIAQGNRTLEAIASAVQASQRGVGVLLDALCPIGLLCKSQGAYSLTPTAEAFLVRGAPTCCADAFLTFWRSRDQLAEVVRTGVASLNIPNPEAEDMWANLAASELLSWPQLCEIARERWTQLGILGETRRGLRVLDVACGSGAGSFVLSQDDPTVRVTALDFPKVLAIAEQVAVKMGVRDKVTFLPGDLMATRLPPEQFDIVLYGAILYYFSPDDVKAVLRKTRGALKPGGLVVIRSIIADEERCQEEAALLLAVELLHDAPGGKVYAFSEYKAFLEASGFTDVSQHCNRLISAKKRAEA